MFNQTIEAYLQNLASDAPTPGGGAAAALTAAQAAALLSMVLSITFRDTKTHDASKPTSKAAPAEQDAIAEMKADLVDARERLLSLASADAAAFGKVMAAYKLSKETDSQKAERLKSIEESLQGATEVPLQLLREVAGLTDMATVAVEKGSKQIISDAGIALALMRAAAKASRYNVLINLNGIKNDDFKTEVASEMKRLNTHIKQRIKLLRQSVDEIMATS